MHSRTRFTPTPIHFIKPVTRLPSCLCHGNERLVDANPGGVDVSQVLDECQNYSSYLVMEWHWSSRTKSLKDTNRLVHHIIRHLQMNPTELENFNACTETKRLDTTIDRLRDGWCESTVDISVPDGQSHRSANDPPIPVFKTPGLLHHSIVETIRAVWSNPDLGAFQYVPFREFWKKPGDDSEQ